MEKTDQDQRSLSVAEGGGFDVEVSRCLQGLKIPPYAVVTAGMPYANGPLHVGHMAGSFVPSDIYARWLRLLCGEGQVLYVSGSDDHGVNSMLTARKSGQEVQAFIHGIREQHQATLSRYQISLDHYGSTSSKEFLEAHTELCQDWVLRLKKSGLVYAKTTVQWFDEQEHLFLADRMVTGQCPVCGYSQAYSTDCEACGAHYDPRELKHARSSVSLSEPVLRETSHLWLDMWKVAPWIYEHLQQHRSWFQKSMYAQLVGDMAPALNVQKPSQLTEKGVASAMPKHKKHSLGGGVQRLVFTSFEDLSASASLLTAQNIAYTLSDGWAYRGISRDVTWGIPMPLQELGWKDAASQPKTLYVWPESLMAPLSFTQQALQKKGKNSDLYRRYWCHPEAARHQFIGVDNVYFYCIMQTALWFGHQGRKDIKPPGDQDLQMSRVHAYFHLQVSGKKMSKSLGNYISADELITERGYTSDQVRYFLAFLSLRDKPSNFDFDFFDKRNAFLAGPLNAALEKPISAAHAHYGGKVPGGKLLAKIERETLKVLRQYVKCMPMAKYPPLLLAVENYARSINSLFATYKPHDNRYPLAEREDALYSCFYILKNLLILLHPFVPATMNRMRQSLQLSQEVYGVQHLGTGIAAGHEVGQVQEYFPAVAGSDQGQ